MKIAVPAPPVLSLVATAADKAAAVDDEAIITDNNMDDTTMTANSIEIASIDGNKNSSNNKNDYNNITATNKGSSSRTRRRQFVPGPEDYLSEGSVPRDHDVLLGRGPLAYKHPGNLRFHRIKLQLQPSYLRAKAAAEKKRISQMLVDRIVATIREYDEEEGSPRSSRSSSRFLKYDWTRRQWYEVPPGHELVRQKASQVLRETYTRATRKQKRDRYKLASTKQRAISSRCCS